MTVFPDFETRSEADLKKVGAWAYSEHPSTEVICACWARDEGAVDAWANPDIYKDTRVERGSIPGVRLVEQDAWEPDGLLYDIARSDMVLGDRVTTYEAFNTAFEYSIWLNVCHKRYGWPMPDARQFRDTQAVACYYALPADLEGLCRVLGLPGKDKEGDRLINRYSKLHNKTAKREIPPEDLRAWLKYCGQDVEQQRRAAYTLGELPEEELEIFLHSFEMGIRGLALDAEGIAVAGEVVDKRAAELEGWFRELTGLNPGQVQAIREWANKRLYPPLPDLQAGTLEEALDEGRVGDEPLTYIEPQAREALELRQQYARASTRKLDAMLRQRGSDGRAHFQIRYHGAATGRPTASGFQALNLARSWEDVDPEDLVRDISYGSPRWLDLIYGDAMEAVGKASRHWIVPGEGCRILAGDFSQIEAVVNACLAGEEWKVQLFRDKRDPYCAFASRALGHVVLPKGHPDRTAQDALDRQEIGKPGELSLGYQGALGAWRKTEKKAKGYTARKRAAARGREIDDATIIKYVRDWRGLHPNIVEQWAALEDAALEAVQYPGRVTGWRDQELFERVDGWLTMILPDGKRLWYWAPQVRMAWPQWHQPTEREECAALECDCRKRPQVTYQARKEGRWRRVHSYGGKWCENRVQATARQIMAAAELRLRDAGYRIVLDPYDEPVCDMPIGQGSVGELEEIMSVPAGAWCANWPVRAEAWEGYRYKK